MFLDKRLGGISLLVGSILTRLSGADPGFQVRGEDLKKLRRAEGSVKNFGVFRVKNHNFTPKNHIFSNFRGGCAFPWIRPWLLLILYCNTSLTCLLRASTLCTNGPGKKCLDSCISNFGTEPDCTKARRR